MAPTPDKSVAVFDEEAAPLAGHEAGDEHIAAEMAALYDFYFSSQQYHKRYPQPNRATLQFMFDHGAGVAGRVLDFGCGDGRYAVPLLERSAVDVTGYDISHAAIGQFTDRIRGTSLQGRTTLLCGGPQLLEGTGEYGTILLLFGVLSHIGDHAARLAALRQMRRLIRRDGQLLLTVPSVFRRRPLELLRAETARASGRATGSQREPGNIFFTRRIADAPMRFFYHLYSVRTLRADLAQAGFELRSASPESLLPEWLITRSSWVGRLDAALLPLVPTSLGYGIRAVATPC
jgi:SAM-dependent methyltransferase